MKILLDTHVLIWAMSNAVTLSPRTTALLTSRDNEILYSAVSIWEIAIKFALKRPDFMVNPTDVISYAFEMDFVELPVFASAAAAVAALPLRHRDPFDRLLLAQAMSAPAILLTSDATLGSYGPPTQMLD